MLSAFDKSLMVYYNVVFPNVPITEFYSSKLDWKLVAPPHLKGSQKHLDVRIDLGIQKPFCAIETMRSTIQIKITIAVLKSLIR